MATIEAPVHSFTDLPGRDYGRGPLSVIRAVNDFGDDQLAVLTRYVAQYGVPFRISAAGADVVFFAHPNELHDILVEKADCFVKDEDYTDPQRGMARFVGHGLLTSDGALWKRQRKLVAPAFHPRRIAAYAETMSDYARRMLDQWPESGTLDFASEMMRLTLAIVGKTLFDVDVRGEAAAPILKTMEALQDMNGALSLLPAWLPTPREIARRRSLRELNALVYRIIDERKGASTDHGDLLSMLILALDDEGQPMSDRQIRDEAVTLFLAGHETTANTLNWTAYALAQNPQVEAELHRELDRVLDGRAPTLADLDNLPYTEMVIKESMRLYPPAWSLGRKTTTRVQIGDTVVEPDVRVVVLTYFAHRDPEVWQDATVFDPARFSPEREPEIPKYAYLPFGGGPRICVGNHFAMMEARLLLASIASRYRMALAPGQSVGLHARITLNPRGGLPMTVTRRR